MRNKSNKCYYYYHVFFLFRYVCSESAFCIFNCTPTLAESFVIVNRFLNMF